MLGYFIESENNDSNMESDFWKYDINSHRWIKLSSNTAVNFSTIYIFFYFSLNNFYSIYKLK